MRQWVRDFCMAVLALLGLGLVIVLFMFLAAVATEVFGMIGGGVVLVLFIAGIIATYEFFSGEKGE